MTTYTYDNIDQLLSESRSGYSCAYTYDANGNRASKTLNGVTDTSTNDSGDKLTSVTWTGGSKTYGYDAAGRTTSVTTSAGTTTLSYDYEGRITGITYPNASTNSFAYNGLDTRVSKVDSSGTRTYMRDGAYVTDAVLSDGAATYTSGISERRSGATTYMHSGLKDNDLQTGGSQNVAAARQYDALGNIQSSTGAWIGPFGFSGAFGYQEDLESGLRLLGHRYYDSSTGRFLTRDAQKDGLNWYVHVENQPTTTVDSKGRNGNKLTNKPAVLYVLLNKAREILKWGITQEVENPRKRYTKKYLDSIDGEVVAVAEGPRIEMAKQERMIVEVDPGPLNRERWAGKSSKANLILGWLIAIVTRDPVAAGEKLGDTVDPYVQDKKRKREAAAEWWLSTET